MSIPKKIHGVIPRKMWRNKSPQTLRIALREEFPADDQDGAV
jgi:hypothetical protein